MSLYPDKLVVPITVMLVSASLIFYPFSDIYAVQNGPFNYFNSLIRLAFEPSAKFNDPLESVESALDRIPALKIIDANLGGGILEELQVKFFDKESLRADSVADAIKAVALITFNIFIITVKTAAQVLNAVIDAAR